MNIMLNFIFGMYIYIYMLLYDICYILKFVSLCYMLLLYYMLVLFLLSGANYCTDYLFTIPVYTIVKLNVLLLLCIIIASIACAILFDL